ncbi:hypothetical protein MTF65_02075 [Streptomyces sp. APSN-46.1]|nr:hypothetical protein [Streptomyces sp. APSN-46.1]MCJ1676166.1 hypothetical protein [Streptomyces sp. APSN-46.1]
MNRSTSSLTRLTRLANLLKLAALRGTLSPQQVARWAEITAAYLRSQAVGGVGDDPVSRP